MKKSVIEFKATGTFADGVNVSSLHSDTLAAALKAKLGLTDK